MPSSHESTNYPILSVCLLRYLRNKFAENVKKRQYIKYIIRIIVEIQFFSCNDETFPCVLQVHDLISMTTKSVPFILNQCHVTYGGHAAMKIPVSVLHISTATISCIDA